MIGFTCNICGEQQETEPQLLDREIPSCRRCGSNVRWRSLVHLLSREVFGESLPLPEMPRLPEISVLGMSDWEGYAVPLAEKFDYTNTYYDREPRLDITAPGREHLDRYDVVIASDVFEHVPPPVEHAFSEACKLLKPEGSLVLTVPYDLGAVSREHFPDLDRFTLAELDGAPILVNRRKDGALEAFDGLVFHGGAGATLELRVFRDQDLEERILGAGFTQVEFQPESYLRFGIAHHVGWSLPIVARKAPLHFPKRAAVRLGQEGEAARREVADLSTRLHETDQRLIGLGEEFEERTRWAKQLDAEVTDLRGRLTALLQEHEERTRWALDLQDELGRARADAARLGERLRAYEASRVRRAARRLRLVREPPAE